MRPSVLSLHPVRPVGGTPGGSGRCDARPVRRRTSLDEVVWTVRSGKLLRLLEEPALIQQELDRRLDPREQRLETRRVLGMGLSSMHVSRPDRRDRLLLISALAIAVLSLLGAAGERIGYDRWLKANTVKRRTHSLFRQGLMLYHHLPNWPEDRIRPLMETFGSMLMEQRVYREVFGVI